MSRSLRRSPICGVTTAASEKQDKRLAHRRLRSATRVAMAADHVGVLPVPREVSDPWDMAKDGKLRFDPQRWPEISRK